MTTPCYRILITILVTSIFCQSFSSGSPLEKNSKDTAGEVEPLKVPYKEKIKNNIRRLLQNSRMGKARQLVNKAIREAKPHSENNDLLAFAYWARAVLEGNASDSKPGEKTPKEKCLEYFDLAVKAGWKNPFTFQYSALIKEDIRNSPKFKEAVENLSEKFEQEQKIEFEERLKKGLSEATGKEPFTVPDNGTIKEILQGKPAMVVITRINHDGFRKAIPVLKELVTNFQERVPTVILFYQNYNDDSTRVKLTGEFLEHNELNLPFTIVNRDYIRPLKIPIFPVFLFLDQNGRLVFRQDGLIHEKFMGKFMKKAFEKLLALAPKVVEDKTDAAKPIEAKSEDNSSEPVDTKKVEQEKSTEPEEAEKNPKASGKGAEQRF